MKTSPAGTTSYVSDFAEVTMRTARTLASAILGVACLAACSDSTGPIADEGSQVALVAAHLDATCALIEDGQAFCWGEPVGGNCSDTCVESPAPVATATRFDTLVIGGSNFDAALCGLAGDGVPHCWGRLLVNLDGGHGLGAAPEELENAIPLTEVGVGMGHICGLGSTRETHCWGDYDGARRGQEVPSPGGLGTDFVPNIVRGGHEFVTLQVADWNTCGIDAAAQVWCWGAGHLLGNTTAPLLTDDAVCGYAIACTFEPVRIEGEHSIVAFADRHGCGVSSTGTLVCWDGELNDSPRAPMTIALPVAVTQAVAGAAHECVLAVDGAAWCWGSNAEGQLGIGQAASADDPTRVNGDLKFRALTAGTAHTCGVTTDSELYCWGANASGQLGTGSRVSVREPTRVVVLAS